MPKYISLVVLLFVLFFTTDKIFASHAMAFDITYECVSQDVYIFRAYFYRDCGGVAPSNNVTISFQSFSCGESFSAILYNTGWTNVSQLCGTTPTDPCNAFPGVSKWEYVGEAIFPSKCPDWIGSYSTSARNAGIANLLTNDGILFTDILINNTGDFCNNSPSFSSTPVPYMCINKPICYNMGTVESDGDSLHFELVNARGTGGIPLVYNPGYSPEQPIATNPAGGLTFNPATGQICFTPSEVERVVVSVKVYEYRNGVIIGTQVREMQFIVTDCTNDPPFVDNPVLNHEVCAGDSISFLILASDLNTNDQVTIIYDSTSIPGSSLSHNGPGRPVLATFAWKTNLNDVGLHNFTIELRDNACPIYGANFYTYTIKVKETIDLGPDKYYCPAGGPVPLILYSNANLTWIPSTGLSCNDCPNPFASPNATTTYIVTSDLNNGCQNTDTVTVFVAPDFDLEISPDVTMCRNQETQLIATTSPASFAPYNFAWDPANSLTDASIADPVASPLSSTTYNVSVTSSEGCQMREQVTVTINGTAPRAYALTDNPVICPDSSVQLNTIMFQDCGPSLSACSETVTTYTVGTGTDRNRLQSPFYGTTIVSAFRKQYIYPKDELLAAGATEGNITSIAFYIDEIEGPALPQTSYLINISISCSRFDEFPPRQYPLTFPFVRELALVKYAYLHTPVLGWNTITLDDPYFWDGESSLIVEICTDAGSLYGTYVVGTNTFPKYYNLTLQNYHSTDQRGCTYKQGNTDRFRPNIQFSICPALPVGLIYSWTPVPTLSNPDIFNPIATPDKNTTYTLNVHMANNPDCIRSNSVDIVLDTSNTVIASPDTTVCAGSVVQLSAIVTGEASANPYTYSWFPADSVSNPTIANPTTTVNSTTTFKVTVTGTKCPVEDSVTVNVINTPAVTIYSPFICAGESTTLTAPPSIAGGSYSWDTGNPADTLQTLIISPEITTDYTVTYTMACGSVSETAMVTVNPKPALTATTSPVTCGETDGSIQATAIDGTAPYSYSIDGSTYQLSGDFTGLDAGTYPVFVIDDAGCSDTTDVIIENSGGLTASVLSKENVNCFGQETGNATIAGNGGTRPYAFSIDGGANFQTDSTFSGLAAGNYTVIVNDDGGCSYSQPVNITQATQLIAGASKNDSKCGDANGSITASASNGTPGYTYSLDGVIYQNDNHFNGLMAGDYWVYVQDMNTCPDSVFITVDNIPGPTAIASTSSESSCGMSNGSVTLGAVTGGTAPYSFNFNGLGFSNSTTYDNLASGDYSLIVKDANDCEHDTIVFINNFGGPTDITVNIKDATCSLNNGSITFEAVTGGTAPYRYKFNTFPYAFGTSYNGISAGTYPISVKDANDCVYSTTVTIGNIAGPTAIEANTLTATCGYNNGSLSLGAVTGGSAPYLYNFNGSGYSGETSYDSIFPGNYNVSVKDTNDCVHTKSITINNVPGPHSIATSSDPANCGVSNGVVYLGNVSGGTPAYVYDFNQQGYAATTTYSGFPAGTYTLSVKDDNDCILDTTVTIAEVNDLAVSVVSKNNVSCFGAANGSATVLGQNSNGYDYAIDGTSFQPSGTFSGLSPGTYTITVKDENNCTATVEVTIEEPALLSVNITHTNVICFEACNGTANAAANGGTAPYTYAWSSGSNAQTTDGLCAGTYTVNVEDANNCSANASVNIDEPAPVTADFTFDPQKAKLSASTICFTDQSTGAVKWFWDFKDPKVNNPFSELENPCHTYKDTGTFCVELIVENNAGCTDTMYHCLEIMPDMDNPFTFFIPNSFTPDNDGINDEFSGIGEHFTDYEMFIFNRWGSMIFYTNEIENKWDGTINNGSGIAQDGVYVYMIRLKDIHGEDHQYVGNVTLIR